MLRSFFPSQLAFFLPGGTRPCNTFHPGAFFRSQVGRGPATHSIPEHFSTPRWDTSSGFLPSQLAFFLPGGTRPCNTFHPGALFHPQVGRGPAAHSIPEHFFARRWDTSSGLLPSQLNFSFPGGTRSLNTFHPGALFHPQVGRGPATHSILEHFSAPRWDAAPQEDASIPPLKHKLS